MVDEKGLKEDVADRIGSFVTMNGKRDLIAKLSSDEYLGRSKEAKRGLDQLNLLFHYLSLLGIDDYILFDLSLARGLDYYTGVIYEAIITTGAEGVGSIAAGGRYDNLVASLSEGNKHSTPCVGISIGIERIFSILEARESADAASSSGEPKKLHPSKVLVASAGKNLIDERFKILRDLWSSNIPSEQMAKKNPKMLDQLQYCEDRGIPIVIIIGENELRQNSIILRDVVTRDERLIPRDVMVNELREMIMKLELGDEE